MSGDHEANLPILTIGDREETTVGNYFVANYPPFSFWTPEGVAWERLDEEPAAGVPFGLYVHIPFCRRRCDFCYFRVYTGRDAKDVTTYLDAVIAELAMYARRPLIRGRKPLFVYFGGGTPSFLDADQLRHLFEGLRALTSWDEAQEVTFECEPGTLDEEKVQALRGLGVTRLSLGVENFDPAILELNNRAHRAKEIDAAWEWIRAAAFPQVNIDLIAGMVGETDANWRECIRKACAMAPESVTVYQMEIPYNTTVHDRMKAGGERIAPVADWRTKRRWVDEAFRALEAGGYHVGSAYTAVKGHDVRFLYRDGLWHGADMLGIGVASFSHLGGAHFQNQHHLEPYLETVAGGRLPIHRGMVLSADERLIREFILQLKLGALETAPFERRHGQDVVFRFGEALRRLERDGCLTLGPGRITLTRQGLLQIDRLLPSFFRGEHRGARYA